MKIAHILLLLSGLLSLAVAPTFAPAQETEDAPKAKAKDNFVDYEALVNEKLSEGITPEKNALVLLWKAFGPAPKVGKPVVPAAYFKRLGIEEPPKGGDYFVELKTFLLKDDKLSREEFGAVYWDHREQARRHPWEANDYPNLAAWLKANEKPLAVVREACQRPGYYSPLISKRSNDRPGNFSVFEMPADQQCREIADALLARAMLSMSERKTDEAWKDILACHRLGRLHARGSSVLEIMAGSAIDIKASITGLAYLDAAGLSSKTILDHLRDLQSLPTAPAIDEKTVFVARSKCLLEIQTIKYDASDLLDSLRLLAFLPISDRSQDTLKDVLGVLPEKLTEEEQLALAKMDWSPAIKSTNLWYDWLESALKIKDRFPRDKELNAIVKEAKESVIGLPRSGQLARLLHARDQADTETVKTISVIMNHLHIGVFRPDSALPVGVQDRAKQTELNLRVAFALAAYKADLGKYPARLADLSPKYLATVPDDLFSGKELIYKPTEKGYLLYSVGPNGLDEGGRGHFDDPGGDDLRVRMPLQPVMK